MKIKKTHCLLCGRVPVYRFAYGDSEIRFCRWCGIALYGVQEDDTSASAETYHRKLEGRRANISATRKRLSGELCPVVDRYGKGSILDVGCGFGEFIEVMRERGWDITGVEPSKSCCTVLYEKGLSFHCGTLSEFAAVAKEKFDHICFWNVLDHLPDPVDDLRKASQLLSGKGRIYIRIPNFAFHLAVMRIARILPCRFFKNAPYAFKKYNFTARGAKNILQASGYGKIVIRNAVPTKGDPYRYSSFLPFSAVNLLKSSHYIFSEFLRIATLNKIFAGSSLLITAEVHPKFAG